MGQPDVLVQSALYLVVIDSTRAVHPDRPSCHGRWRLSRWGIFVRDYQLAEHVHACITPLGAIFLDLERDTYSGIDANQVRALSEAVEGWPDNENGTNDMHGVSTRDGALAASLCATGVLVPRSKPGRPHHPLPHDPPTDELIAWRYMRPTQVRIRDVLSFLRVLLTTLVLLRCRPMSAVAARAQRLSGSGDGSACDLDRARELVTVYTYIRMFVFARRGRCLLDSLALLEFLAAHDIHVKWLIGVRMRPFAAHSWLQHQNWVLNGTPAFVRGFHAIFTT